MYEVRGQRRRGISERAFVNIISSLFSGSLGIADTLRTFFTDHWTVFFVFFLLIICLFSSVR